MSSGRTDSPRGLQRFAPWLPAVAYMALIWAISSMSAPPSTHAFPFKDKGVHFVEYGVLSVFLCYALFGGRRGLAQPRHVGWALAAAGLTAFWGLIDEIHQAYVPGRSSEAMDVLADTLGALIGAGLFLVYRRLRARPAAESGPPRDA